MPLRLGSRRSALAQWQAREVQRRLAELRVACDLVLLETTGDRRTDVSLAAIGGKGLFTQELEAALLEGSLDFAVHSLKDVPAEIGPGLVLETFLEREDPRDALIAAAGTTLATLPAGARVGTSSLRRQAQVRALRPDLAVLDVRGNVDTRLRRWRAGDFDALLLACAGLSRLGLEAAIAERLDPQAFCPAAGQGVLAIECRADDARTRGSLRRLHHAPTAVAVTAERSLLRALQCGCLAPVGAWARFEGGTLRLDAMVATPDGSTIIRRSAVGEPEHAAALGEQVARELLRGGAREILAALAV